MKIICSMLFYIKLSLNFKKKLNYRPESVVMKVGLMVVLMVEYLESSHRAAVMVSIMDDERVDTMAPWTASAQAETTAFLSAQ